MIEDNLQCKAMGCSTSSPAVMPPPDAAEEAAKQRKMEPVKSFRKATHQVSGDDAAEGGRSYADRASEAEMRRASTDDGNPYEHLDPEGSTYVGARSSAGLPNGNGKRVYADGSVYDGQWRDGEPHGKGTEVSVGGATYVGDFVEGKRHGKGKFKSPTGDLYDGDYREGKKTGYGSYKFSSGESYVGNIRDGKQHGQGRYVTEDGDVYEGQYHDGMMHGRGKYTFADGTVDHDGEWAEDDPVDEDGYPINK